VASRHATLTIVDTGRDALIRISERIVRALEEMDLKYPRRRAGRGKPVVD